MLPISMDKVSQVSTRLGSKVNIHPLVDQCIPRTDHRNPEKGKFLPNRHSKLPEFVSSTRFFFLLILDDQRPRHRVPLRRRLAIHTEATPAVRILRRRSSDRTVSNRHRAVPARRRHRRLVRRVLPVSHRLAVHPDSNRRRRSRPRDIRQPRSNHHNRTTTGPIRLVHQNCEIEALKINAYGVYFQPNQPRRHPDFEKNQQPYPPYQQRPQMYRKYHCFLLVVQLW